MSIQFDENNHGMFEADGYPTCGSPYCSNRLSGEQISNGEACCSDECNVDIRMGCDIVLFDDPFDVSNDEDDIPSEEDTTNENNEDD